MNATEGWGGDFIRIILGAVAENFTIADLIGAVADKIEALVDASPSSPSPRPSDSDLLTTNNSVGNVFAQVCCMLNAINGQIERGTDLLQTIQP